MSPKWSDDSPIYKQLEWHLIGQILTGKLGEGEALPSVRKLSLELQINHLTVAKSVQALVEADLVEKKRGLGMFVLPGVRERLLEREREKFFSEELPKLFVRSQELSIHIDDLISALNTQYKEPSS